MIKLKATGTVNYLKEGNRKFYFILVDVTDWETWPFPSDAFPIFRGKSRNKKFKQDEESGKFVRNRDFDRFGNPADPDRPAGVSFTTAVPGMEQLPKPDSQQPTADGGENAEASEVGTEPSSVDGSGS